MAVIPYNEKEVKLLARLMRAEAEGEGQQGMLMVGNVGVNRVRSDCLDFKKLANLQDMVFQSPGGFEATQKSYFYQRARQKEIDLARKTIKGGRYHPASYSLWFFKPAGNCPAEWYNQSNAGRFKSHCFYQPTQGDCPKVY
ncbi:MULTISPECIES: cell wall hydrolase [Rossellomorea]|jgi:N-acetylmuramoyl-L-alanine amidase|uniref:Cell wall hydrolase n=1 Tax=Rossellomorea vietnamensis TaxID=218284 RepID=A0ACD4C3S9_9BACI|nr:MULTISPECIES: cell wall hydrolase [Rossellomorea]MCA0151454.1 cell wall hydrolase [Rossellomorea vietnamensis]MCC5803382.1 cell wall hydrolase [Rossellomorea vietnamensis]UTE77622.1 cell wall hydrolase [Rossellomorea sp. KS-H15a]UXH43067.1 cell wall hydrolase [Rossellomorea vietnamensis]WGG45565.1 cell wall hydrolase [Rossellomorea sp. DA94]